MIDLRKELIKHLGQRVSMLSDYQLPITTTSERLLFAIEAKNPKAVAAALAKLFKDDKTYKRRGTAGHVIWEMVEEEDARHRSPDDRPPQRRRHAGPGAKGTRPAGGDEERRRQRGEALAAPRRRDGLRGAPPGRFPHRLPAEGHCPGEEGRAAGQGSRLLAGWTPKSRFGADGQMLPLLFRGPTRNIAPPTSSCGRTRCRRAKRCWGGSSTACSARARRARRANNRSTAASCPTTTSSRRYLGPAGMQITSEPDGWFLKGFLLPHPAPAVRCRR